MKNVWGVVEMIFATIAWSGFVVGVGGVLYYLTLSIYTMPWSSTEFWFYRWQTLIAGMLAVLAAGLTVRQMQISDRKQQTRHDDLLRLNLRADKLTLERAVIPLTQYLRDSISEIDEKFQTYKTEPKQSLPFYRSTAEALQKIVDLTDSEDIGKAQHLYGPLLHQTVLSARREALKLKSAIILIKMEISSIEDPMFRSLNELPSNMDGARLAYANMRFHAELLADDLDELLGHYT